MRPLKKFWKKVHKYHKKKCELLFTGFHDPILKRFEESKKTENAFDEITILEEVAKHIFTKVFMDDMLNEKTFLNSEETL